MTDNHKKWILITGGSRGIGRGLVEALADEYRIVFTYANNKAIADTFVNEQKKLGNLVDCYKCNGKDSNQVKLLADKCIAQYGAPYAIINNAGITQDALTVSMTDENWHSVISANLDASFYIARAFLPSMMSERTGVLLLMSSVTAVKGNQGQVNYAATKAGMIGLARSLALEVARFKIRVNAIAPGLIATEMADNIPEKERKALQSSIPLRRMGKISEVAELAKYLLSSPAEYITGQTIIIDGGMTA